ncbi:MAG: hypothetical protein AAEJ43_06850 [Gammaproteobacteria bacterium]
MLVSFALDGHASPLAEETGAAAYLEFATRLDGHCQILSEGGKLRVLRNTHAVHAIKYRLVRKFVGVAQGLSVGVAPPGGEIVKLGCSQVDGRQQEWIVERASFIAAGR